MEHGVIEMAAKSISPTTEPIETKPSMITPSSYSNFFIKRAEDFLNTVGKEVFGIEHYWGRIEFAKGRGQIHLHLLAILNKMITKDLQDELNDGGRSHADQSKLVGDWAERIFGMTSSVNGNNG